jgi:hypothetical protein
LTSVSLVRGEREGEEREGEEREGEEREGEEREGEEREGEEREETYSMTDPSCNIQRIWPSSK